MISSKPTATAVHHRDDNEIRQRLLNKLGIFFGGVDAPPAPPPSPHSPLQQLFSSSSPPPPLSMIESDVSSCCSDSSPEKQDIHEKGSDSNNNGDEHGIPTYTTAEAATDPANPPKYLSLLDYTTLHHEPLQLQQKEQQKKKKTIQFVSQVTVIHIPSHHDYPKKVYHKLWNTLYEIQSNGQRNAIEYEADGRDWKKATEEDSFIISVGGRLFHPATYQYMYSSCSPSFCYKQEEEEEEEEDRGLRTISTTPIKQQQQQQQHKLKKHRRKKTRGGGRRSTKNKKKSRCRGGSNGNIGFGRISWNTRLRQANNMPSLTRFSDS